MRKNILGLFAIIIATPAFSDITNQSTCDTNVLGQSNNESIAQTEAIWNANTININWYNGDTRIAQNTCIYDSQISLPTEPTKPGYTFSGWRLRVQKVNPFAGLDASIKGTEGYAHDSSGCLDRNGYSISCPSDLALNEWKVVSSYGTVYGKIKLSAKTGNSNKYTFTNDESNWLATEEELNISGTQNNCWCQLTALKTDEGTQTVSSNLWVYILNTNSMCARTCVLAFTSNYSAVRSTLFEVAGR